MIKSRFPNVKLIENNGNKTKGNNMELPNSRRICILNPDTVVAEDTFVKFSCKKKKVRIIGVKLIDRGIFT
jgi:GT2 family glycosyltransferase